MIQDKLYKDLKDIIDKNSEVETYGGSDYFGTTVFDEEQCIQDITEYIKTTFKIMIDGNV